MEDFDGKIKRSMVRDFLIRNAEDKIFGATFKKKDETIRDIQCRIHVHKGVKGTKPHYKEDKKNKVLTVYDMNLIEKKKKGGWRRINLETLMTLRIRGMKFKIIDD